MIGYTKWVTLFSEPPEPGFATKLAVGHDEAMLAHLQLAVPGIKDIKLYFGPCVTFGLMKESGPMGSFCGAAVFNNYCPWNKDVELNIFSIPHILNKGICIALSRYAFGILACERLSITLPRSAKPLRRMAEKAGFKREGTLRLGWRGTENAQLYGMLKSECRWFDQENWDKEQADAIEQAA